MSCTRCSPSLQLSGDEQLLTISLMSSQHLGDSWFLSVPERGGGGGGGKGGGGGGGGGGGEGGGGGGGEGKGGGKGGGEGGHANTL